jgi:CRAL/TRIO domain
MDRLIWMVLDATWQKRWLCVGLAVVSLWLFRYFKIRPVKSEVATIHEKRRRVSVVNRERRRRLPRALRDDVQFRFSISRRNPVFLDSVDLDGDDVDDKMVDTLEEENLKYLEEKIPESTVQERRRFLDGRLGNRVTAARDLKSYLSWIHKNKALTRELVDDSDSRLDDDSHSWNRAAAVAMKLCGYKKSTGSLLRVIRTFTRPSDQRECCDKAGHRLFVVRPAIMDERLAPLTVYSAALAIYLDQKLRRDSTERITLLIDVRPGQGWRNLHVTKLVSFMSDTFKNLISKFPERLAIAVVFPFPASFRWIWSIVKQVLDQDTSQRIMLFTGAVHITSPPPLEQMVTVIDRDVVDILERERRATFSPVSN